MVNFALIGASGFVAPRHRRAIRDVGGRLVAVLDPAPAGGLPEDARAFTDPGDFRLHLEELRAGPAADRVEFVSICSPNDLHDAHIRLALGAGATALCEKPILLDPRGLRALQEVEGETGRRVYTVLQLRLHPRLLALRARLPERPPAGSHEVALSFVSRRGPAYFASWKGDEARSGGLAMNIGVHYFDLLLWIFGAARRVEVTRREPATLEGTLDLERARVRWLLSVDEARLPRMDAGLPPAAIGTRRDVHRSLTVDGEEVDFTGGFEDLHTAVYREILAGRGAGIEEARPSVELVDRIRRGAATGSA